MEKDPNGRTRRIDMTGQKLGKLTVIKYVGSWGTQSRWLCKCECGNECIKPAGQLRKLQGLSCGCDTRQKFIDAAHRTIAKTKHGDCFSRLYFVWIDVRNRCNNPKDVGYKNYGARGIKVCDEWQNDYVAFKKWAMENGYNPNAKRGECTLDRIDNSKGYSPDNCRWANMTTQSNNRRNTVRLTFEGENHSLAEWSRITGITLQCLQGRVKANWPIEDILCKDNFRHKKRDERHFH